MHGTWATHTRLQEQTDTSVLRPGHPAVGGSEIGGNPAVALFADSLQRLNVVDTVGAVVDNGQAAFGPRSPKK